MTAGAGVGAGDGRPIGAERRDMSKRQRKNWRYNRRQGPSRKALGLALGGLAAIAGVARGFKSYGSNGRWKKQVEVALALVRAVHVKKLTSVVSIVMMDLYMRKMSKHL